MEHILEQSKKAQAFSALIANMPPIQEAFAATLRQLTQQNAQQDWIKTGQMQLSEKMTGNQISTAKYYLFDSLFRRPNGTILFI